LKRQFAGFVVEDNFNLERKEMSALLIDIADVAGMVDMTGKEDEVEHEEGELKVRERSGSE
jgi:hypothetical protein